MNKDDYILYLKKRLNIKGYSFKYFGEQVIKGVTCQYFNDDKRKKVIHFTPVKFDEQEVYSARLADNQIKRVKALLKK